MRTTAATMLSAAILLGPGCADDAAPQPPKDEPLRRAGFRSFAAHQYFASCPGAAAGRDLAYQATRHEELKQLAARSGAGNPVALGENEWAGLSRNSPPERCEVGDEAYRQALARYRGALDILAARIADYPAQRDQRP